MNSDGNLPSVENNFVYGGLGMTSHAVPTMETGPTTAASQYTTLPSYATQPNAASRDPFRMSMSREPVSTHMAVNSLQDSAPPSFSTIEQDENLLSHKRSGMQFCNEMEGDATEEQLMNNCLEPMYQGMGEDAVDRRSVFVGNVDYGTTPLELQEHFKVCGSIKRITIMVDRFTGHPKGYAYIEFQDESAVAQAVGLSDSIFRERPLKVTPKRKNIPGFTGMVGARGGRGMPFSGVPFRGRFGRGYLSAFGPRGRRGMGPTPGYFPRYRGRTQRPYGPY